MLENYHHYNTFYIINYFLIYKLSHSKIQAQAEFSPIKQFKALMN